MCDFSSSYTVSSVPWESHLMYWGSALIWLRSPALVQGIVITDPYLMAEVLQSKDFDKEPRTYKALDSVCPHWP